MPMPGAAPRGLRRRLLLAPAAGALVAGIGLPLLQPRAARAASIQAEHPALRPLLEAAAGDGSNTHGVIVQQAGRKLAEAYYLGRDKPSGAWFEREVDFDAGTLHDLRSVTKSVVGLLVGIAQQRGLFGPAGLGRPVFDFFPDHADLLDEPRRQLTLRHLVDMATGWEWDENTYSYGDPRNSEVQMALALDPLRHALERPFVAAPGTKWEYCGGATKVLGEVLQRVGGRPLADLARAWLFEPLGITRFEWRQSRGQALPASGLRLTPRDLATLGRVVLAQGRWDGREVVPAAWVADLSTPRFTGWDGYRYGAQWWMARAPRTAASAASTPAPTPAPAWVGGWGNGGQRLLVVPSMDLVVVVTAGRYNRPASGRESMALFLAVVRALRG